MVGAGCRNAEIATALKISPKTVDTYRENLKQKLGLSNSDALLRAAKGWVERGEFGHESASESAGRHKPANR
jgi:DNA-binding NarL/FixJ family response regulator